MNTLELLKKRSNDRCELCSENNNLSVYEVSPSDGSIDQVILICETCKEQIQDPDKIDVNHWHCLNGSMWSEFPSVQVMAYRMLTKLSAESWARDLLDQFYLDEETLKWAQTGLENEKIEPTKDSNGNLLQDGDTVTLIKDLNVKGANFTAKRGTVVKNIKLTENPEHIEGKIGGTQIVLVSAYLKRS